MSGSSSSDFVRPGGQWPAECVPGASDGQRFDQAQAESVNGDNGGTYTPAGPIVVGGSGISVTGAAAFTGGVLTTTGGRIRAYLAYPSVNTRSRAAFVPIVECGLRVDVTTGSGGSQREDTFLSAAITGAGVYGISFSSTTAAGIITIPRRYMHHGARLASVKLNFAIQTQPASVPSPAVSIAIYACPYVGGGAVGMTPLIPSVLWAATTVYAHLSYVAPLAHINGYFYQASTGGTSGGSEPTWGTTIGGTTADGSVVWTCIGRDGRYPVLGATPLSYFAHGAAQTIEYDPAGATGANTIDTTANSYQVWVQNPDPAMIVTGLSFVYDTITSLQPE